MEQIENTQTEEIQNATFIEETMTNTELPIGSKPVDQIITRTDIGEGIWNVHEMLAKPIRIFTGQWPTTATIGTLLNVVSGQTTPTIIKDVLTANVESMQTNILKSYTFLKFKAVFKIQLNSTKFYNGRLLFGYIPLSQQNPVLSFTTMSMLPNVGIDAGNSEPAVLEVPWFHPCSSFNQTVDTEATNNLGRLFLGVISPLKAPGGAAAAVNYTIWMHLTEVDVHVPINPQLTYLTPQLTRSHIKQIVATLRKNGYRIEDGLNTPHALTGGGGSLFDKGKSILGGGVNTIKRGISGIGKLFEGDFGGAFDDMTEALAEGLETAAEGASVAVEVGMLDKPYDVRGDIGKSPAGSSFAFGCGAERLHKLDISPFSMFIPNASVVGRTTDFDMDFIKQMQRESILRVVSWTTTQVTKTSLFDQEITPTEFTSGFGKGTWLKVLSEPWLYWTGSIKISFSVVATHFHAGRLIAIFSNGFVNTLPDMDECVNWPFVTIDLHNTDNREYEMVIPYNSNTPFLVNGAPATALVPRDRSSLGHLALFVVNQLEAPETVAPSVDIIVKVCAGDDFRVWTPRDIYPYNPYSVAIKPTIGGGAVNPIMIQPLPTDEFEELNCAHADDLFIQTEEFVKCMKDCGETVRKMYADHVPVIQDLTERWRRYVVEHKDYKSVPGMFTNIANLNTKLLNVVQNYGDVLHMIQDKLDTPEVVEDLIDRLKKVLDNTPHAGAVENVDEDTDLDKQPVMQKGGALTASGFSHGSMTMTSDVRDLVRRYGYCGSVHFLFGTNSHETPVLQIPVMPTLSLTHLSYYSKFFVGWCGSLRYKFVFHTSNATSMIANVWHVPSMFSANFTMGFLPQDTGTTPAALRNVRTRETSAFAQYTCNIIDEKTMTVDVPYLSPYHFLRNVNDLVYNGDITQMMNGSLLMLLSMKLLDGETKYALPVPKVVVDVYISAGDDFYMYFPMPANLIVDNSLTGFNTTVATNKTEVIPPPEEDDDNASIVTLRD